MSQFEITEDEVLEVISHLNVNKSIGYDNISNKMLKLALPHICVPLTYIFNASLASGKYPEQWKRANVTPVYKNGKRQELSNYRPISLLSNVSKIFERIIHNKMYAYLMSNDLLTPRNSGYKSNDSTVSQLTAICHRVYTALEDKKEARMVFLDASKAFDRVWHLDLIFKLEQIGICRPLVTLLKNYLSNRHQRVLISGKSSTWQP